MAYENVILTHDGLTVTIATETDVENLTKPLTLLTPAKTSRDTDPTSDTYGPNESLILDLMMMEKRITITGYLVTGLRTTTQGDSSENAEDKKADLKKIFLGGKCITITYDGATFTAGFEKLEVRRLNTDDEHALDGVAEFAVTATFVRGTDMV